MKKFSDNETQEIIRLLETGAETPEIIESFLANFPRCYHSLVMIKSKVDREKHKLKKKAVRKYCLSCGADVYISPSQDLCLSCR